MNIRIFLTVALVACAQSAQADLAVQAAPAPETLQAVVAQGQTRSVESLTALVTETKPSAVALDIGTDPQTGIRFTMEGDFTPDEIDQYPQYKNAFANHAADMLGSDNPADHAATNHLLAKYPDLASFLTGRAEALAGNLNNEMRKSLNRANRQPIMTAQSAILIAGKAVAFDLAGTVHSAIGIESKMQKDLRKSKIDFFDVYVNPGMKGNDVGYHYCRRVDCIKKREASFSDDVWKAESDELSRFTTRIPKTVTVAVGTAALTNLALRELDERVGDPLPTPKYRRGGDNTLHYAYTGVKYFLRNFAVPYLISTYGVAPLYDKASQAIRGE